MLNKILKLKIALMLLLGLSLFYPGAYAQRHDDGHNGGRDVSRGSVAQGQDRGQRTGHGNRHYYHNGKWNRNGWYGLGASGPVMTDGYRVETLPPGYTTVNIAGSTYFYGNESYFRQSPSGGYMVVTLHH